MRENIQTDLAKIFGSKFGLADSELTPQAELRDELGLDSLDFIEMVMEVEQVFNISIPEEDYPGIITYDGLVSYVEGAIEGKRLIK